MFYPLQGIYYFPYIMVNVSNNETFNFKIKFHRKWLMLYCKDISDFEALIGTRLRGRMSVPELGRRFFLFWITENEA